MGKAVDVDVIIGNCNVVMADMFKNYPNKYFTRKTVLLLVEMLCKTAPAIDTVKHGKWINGDCSECGYPIPTDDRIDFIKKDEVHYCYNCGAKMDGEQ